MTWLLVIAAVEVLAVGVLVAYHVGLEVGQRRTIKAVGEWLAPLEIALTKLEEGDVLAALAALEAQEHIAVARKAAPWN